MAKFVLLIILSISCSTYGGVLKEETSLTEVINKPVNTVPVEQSLGSSVEGQEGLKEDAILKMIETALASKLGVPVSSVEDLLNEKKSNEKDKANQLKTSIEDKNPQIKIGANEALSALLTLFISMIQCVCGLMAGLLNIDVGDTGISGTFSALLAFLLAN